ncbi:MAG: CvpA family protein [Bacteroidota bacterium]
MNLFDLILLAILLFFSVQGYRNGLVRELFSVAGILTALWVMTHFLDPMVEWMSLFVDASETALHVVAATMLFLSVYLLALLLALIIQKVLETIHLNVINRLAGLLFGTLKATLLLMAILLITGLVGFPGSETTDTSLFYPLLTDAIPELLAEWIPGRWVPDAWLNTSVPGETESWLHFIPDTFHYITETDSHAVNTIFG